MHQLSSVNSSIHHLLFIPVPSQPPTAFQLSASSSTSITASWQLPPIIARHGAITGFKLFYKKKGSGKPATTLPISNGATLNTNVTRGRCIKRTIAELSECFGYQVGIASY